MSFCKIVQNRQYHMKVLLNRFHLNDCTLVFLPLTQKLQQHLLTQGWTLGVKGLHIDTDKVKIKRFSCNLPNKVKT